MSDFFSFFPVFLAGMLVSALVLTIYFLTKIAKYRKQAVKQSRSVILGEVTEKMTPLFPDFPYQTKDMVFLGKGVDYVIFDGLSEGNLKQIVFLEVKIGKSQLNRNERMIRDIINARRVSYEVLQVKY